MPLRAVGIGSIVLCLLLVAQTAALQTTDGPSPLPDGTPLSGEQFPRFLKPTHEGEFGFDNFLVLGDVPSLRFERPDPSEESGVVVETWPRVAATRFGGRSVSVFRLAWPVEILREALRVQRWGVDRPYLFWGEAGAVEAPESRRRVYLQLVPPNLPRSETVRLSDTVQYASHAVNVWLPDFGRGRPNQGEAGLELEAVARAFYEFFGDQFETLAVVSQTALFSKEPFGWRQLVQNQIVGLGLNRFDTSGRFGSQGVLQGIEVYPPGGWATAEATLHQQAHQWGDYSRLWGALGIRRQGAAPEIHTPLLGPGEVLSGAVLDGTRRIGTPDGVTFLIERTTPHITYHPLTLYRMGLIEAQGLPDLAVFREQGQFDPLARSAPAVGSVVGGDHVVVSGQDLVDVDGDRVGPAISRVRRALVYVSRTGLASPEEMDVVNFYAARLEQDEGVTSWEGYPSFLLATGGLSTLETAVAPRPGIGPEAPEPIAAPVYLDVASDALTDVRLDQPIPGRIPVGQSVPLSGDVTADDVEEVGIACFRFIRYGSPDPNEVFVCSSVTSRRFEMELQFISGQQGRYTVEPFLFAATASRPVARARYGVITVE